MPHSHSSCSLRLHAQATALALFTGAILATTTGCGSGIIGQANPAATSPTVAPSAVQSGPQLGYIWSDTTHTLRPVLGVAGSSQLGQSVVPADLYISAAASSASNIAILQESDGALNLMSLPSGQPVRLTATLAPGAQIRFSPSGANAVAFVPGSTSVAILTSLSGTPASASASFNGAISEAAVSDTGSIAVVTPTAVRTLSSGGTMYSALAVAAVGGLTFERSTDDLLVADASANTITLVRNSTSSPSPSTVQSANLLKSPHGLGVSRDNRWAVLANTGDPSIVRVDLTAQTAPQSFQCSCQPALVAQLSGTGVFRVTAADSGPAWMLDAASTTPRVLFIPASKVASAASAPQGQN